MKKVKRAMSGDEARRRRDLAVAAASKARNEAVAPAWKAYDEAVAAAAKARNEAVAPAAKAYDEAVRRLEGG